MNPALRPRFTIEEIHGNMVVTAEIDEVPAAQKPCYYKNLGLPKGAFIRVGNTNRQMTDYEVFGYLSSQGQPRYDEELVAGATLNDLSNDLISAYLDRIRLHRQRSGFLDGLHEGVLKRLHIVGIDGQTVHPTLAGLLMFGKYPQEFFPQLRITYVHYYGTSPDEKAPSGARFLDDRVFEGPIPEMINQAEKYILGAMRKSALIEGMFRRDIYEYPQEALREALANAVAHRDYSQYVRGSYIQVRMFADRLEVQSPGGLHGNVTVENIESEHSTRNACLMRMMEDMHIVENRGSGISAMIGAMREANLEPPGFNDRRASFQVIFHNHTLMSPEAVSWLNQFAGYPLDDRQRVALVYMRNHGQITNEDYRRLNRIDTGTATQDLRTLVQTGLVDQRSAGRGTYYTLTISGDLPSHMVLPEDERRILDYTREKGSITNEECRRLLEINPDRAFYLLDKLCKLKQLKPEGTGRWRKYIIV
jgi:ATP-dependent DNA helicase RecG